MDSSLQSSIMIKIKQHKKDNEDCPCIENEENVRKFDEDIRQFRKRSRPNASRSMASKSMRSDLEDVSPVSEVAIFSISTGSSPETKSSNVA